MRPCYPGIPDGGFERLLILEEGRSSHEPEILVGDPTNLRQAKPGEEEAM
jgi:hypothetical protein